MPKNIKIVSVKKTAAKVFDISSLAKFKGVDMDYLKSLDSDLRKYYVDVKIKTPLHGLIWFIRCLLLSYIPVKSLVCDADDIVTDDDFIIKYRVIRTLMMVPISQDIKTDSKISLPTIKGSIEKTKILSKYIKIVSDGKELVTSNVLRGNIPLHILSENTDIEIKNIKIVEDIAQNDAVFSYLENVRYDYDSKHPTLHISSDKNNVFSLGYTTYGNIEPADPIKKVKLVTKKMFADFKLSLVDKKKELEESYDMGEMVNLYFPDFPISLLSVIVNYVISFEEVSVFISLSSQTKKTIHIKHSEWFDIITRTVDVIEKDVNKVCDDILKSI